MTTKTLTEYQQTLIWLTELAAEAMPEKGLATEALAIHEQIFAGLSFYAYRCIDTAPNSEVAGDFIDAAVKYGFRINKRMKKEKADEYKHRLDTLGLGTLDGESCEAQLDALERKVDELTAKISAIPNTK
jgi:hypothetical protein